MLYLVYKTASSLFSVQILQNNGIKMASFMITNRTIKYLTQDVKFCTVFFNSIFLHYLNCHFLAAGRRGHDSGVRGTG